MNTDHYMLPPSGSSFSGWLFIIMPTSELKPENLISILYMYILYQTSEYPFLLTLIDYSSSGYLTIIIHRALKRQGKYPPLFTDTEVNNNCVSIYTKPVSSQ